MFRFSSYAETTKESLPLPLETMHEDVCRLSNLHQDMFANPERATKGAFHSWPLETIDEGEPFNTKNSLKGEAGKNGLFIRLTRNEHRFFKHI